MLIQAVKFWRTEKDKKDGKAEAGIMINNDQLMVDEEGKVVEGQVWDYRILPHVMTIETPPVERFNTK